MAAHCSCQDWRGHGATRDARGGRGHSGLGRWLRGHTGGVRGTGGFCKKGAWGTCIMAGAFVNDIGFHADRASRTAELVVKTTPLQRKYELCITECKRRVCTPCRLSCPPSRKAFVTKEARGRGRGTRKGGHIQEKDEQSKAVSTIS